MSFQAYLDNIKEKTGKGPDDFRRLAEKKGLLLKGAIAPGVKAGQIVDWLKDDFELGRGHAMAIYALFKGMKGAGEKTGKPAKSAKTTKKTAAPKKSKAKK